MNEIIDRIDAHFLQNRKQRNLILILGVLLALAIRVFFLWVPSWDMGGIQAAWYDELIKVGRIDAFAKIFYNYTPAPVYLIDIMTLFRFIPKEPAMKLITFPFDFFAAWGVWKILNLKWKNGFLPWAGFLGFLFLPTVFVESGMWGQTDIVFASFLVWCFYYIQKEKLWWAFFFLSLSFCFKLQSLFLGPLLLLLFVRKKTPFYYFFAIPVTYFVSVLPAWIIGSPLKDLLLTYFLQFSDYHELTKRAPNLYIYLTANVFDPYYRVIVIAGIVVTLLVIFGYIILRTVRWKDLGKKSLAFDAALFTLVIPFLLPKMHDRYFYAGCVFLFILSFYEIRALAPLVLAQIGSLLAFIPYFSGWSTIFVMFGTPFMLVAVIWLALLTHKNHLGLQKTSAAAAELAGTE